MYKSHVFSTKNKLWILGSILFCQFTNAQLLELDFTYERREESNFKIHLVRYGIIGVSSLQHLDLSAEVIKMKYDAKNGFYLGFSIFSTQTLWRGNKVDELNTFDFLMNPIGGTAEWKLFC
jgi:hypothetical protein